MEQLALPYSDDVPEQEARAGFQPIRSRISDRAWQCVLCHGGIWPDIRHVSDVVGRRAHAEGV